MNDTSISCHEQSSSRVYLTVKQFSQRHPAFPEGGLRWRIFHAKENGLDESGAIVRNGRRILINEQRFFEWLEKQGGKR